MRIRVVTAVIALTAAALLGAAGTAAADSDSRVAVPEDSGSGLFWPGEDLWWPASDNFWPGVDHAAT